MKINYRNNNKYFLGVIKLSVEYKKKYVRTLQKFYSLNLCISLNCKYILFNSRKTFEDTLTIL